MRTVLCFGDSNTWGYVPGTGARLPRHERWPGLLASSLGDDWHVIEEGLCGRTATVEDPLAPGRAGLDYLEPCLDSHAPLDVVVIFLGTNDLADRYGLPPADAAGAIARLAAIVQRSPDTGVGGAAPRVVLVAPPPFGRLDREGSFASAAGKAERLARQLRTEAQLLGCGFVDLGEVVRYSDVDGVHFNPVDHPAVARVVERAVRDA